MSRARDLSNLGNINSLAVDTADNEVGIATTAPRSTLDVRGELQVGTGIQVGSAGVVTATSFSGSGANLTGLATTETVRTDTLTVAGVSTLTGAVNIDATTDSTSTTTGALIVDGGAAIAKNVYIGAGLSVAGTLTYEDVTNVDSVGLITAKSGVNVSGGQLAVGVAYSVGAAGVATAAGFVGPLTGAVTGTTGSFSSNLTVGSGITFGSAGVATFSGTSDVHLLDNVVLNIGDGSDLKLYHNGSNSYVTGANTGNLLLQAHGNIKLMPANGEDAVEAVANDAVKLYYNNSQKFQTTNDGTVTTGIATATVGLDVTGGTLGLRLGTGATVFSPGSNLLALGTNDNERLRIQSDGRINIETAISTANVPLVEIYNKVGSVMTGQCLKLRSNRGQGVIDTAIFAIHDDGDDEIFRVDNAGQVGIGTTVCGSELHVMQSKSGGESHASSQITLERSGTNYLQFLTANDGTSGLLFGDVADNDGAKIVYDHNVDQMQFNTGTVQRLHITNNGGFSFSNGELVERVNITAGKMSDNTNIDLQGGMVHYFTTQETTTCTPDIRVSGSISLNSVMDAGDVVTVTVITTAAAGGYSANWTIDGNAVTEEWVGGSAPSAGGSDGLDIYVLTIICTHATNTGDSGFKVIANLTNAT